MRVLSIDILCHEMDGLEDDIDCSFLIEKCSKPQLAAAAKIAAEAYRLALINNLPPSADVTLCR